LFKPLQSLLSQAWPTPAIHDSMHLPFFFLKQGSLNATLHGTTGGRSQKQSSPSQQSLRHRPPLTQSLTHSPPLFVHSSEGGHFLYKHAQLLSRPLQSSLSQFWPTPATHGSMHVPFFLEQRSSNGHDTADGVALGLADGAAEGAALGLAEGEAEGDVLGLELGLGLSKGGVLLHSISRRRNVSSTWTVSSFESLFPSLWVTSGLMLLYFFFFTSLFLSTQVLSMDS